MTAGAKSRKAKTRSSGRFLELLEPMMDAPGVARDAYRISLVGNFFNGPVYVTIQKHYGLIRDEINTLFCLAHFPELIQTDICLVMGRPKNSVSRSIARLVQRDLISVRDDPGDGRKGVLSLRPRGRELYEKTRQLFVEREEQILASLTKSDLASLDRLLTKIMKSHENWSELF
jgi:DNA-binding MarR family transcriptional regulator